MEKVRWMVEADEALTDGPVQEVLHLLLLLGGVHGTFVRPPFGRDRLHCRLCFTGLIAAGLGRLCDAEDSQQNQSVAEPSGVQPA